MVQVHYGEGIANHTGPESCAAYSLCRKAIQFAGRQSPAEPLPSKSFLLVDERERPAYCHR